MSTLTLFLLFLGILILFLLPDERTTTNDEWEEQRTEGLEARH